MSIGSRLRSAGNAGSGNPLTLLPGGVAPFLAFLGLGDATVKSWGGMLFFALRDPAVYFTGRWAWSVLPAAFALSALLFAIALAGIALEARSDRRIGGGTG